MFQLVTCSRARIARLQTINHRKARSKPSPLLIVLDKQPTDWFPQNCQSLADDNDDDAPAPRMAEPHLAPWSDQLRTYPRYDQTRRYSNRLSRRSRCPPPDSSSTLDYAIHVTPDDRRSRYVAASTIICWLSMLRQVADVEWADFHVRPTRFLILFSLSIRVSFVRNSGFPSITAALNDTSMTIAADSD